MSQLGVPLRPLGLGDLFDGAVRIFRQQFGLLFGMSVLALTPIAVIGAAVQLLAAALARTAGPATAVLLFVPLLLSVPIYFAAFDVSFGAQVYAVSQARFGRRTTMGEAFRHALRHFWPMLGVQLVYLIALGLMFVTFIGIPFALYFAIAWGFVFHAVLLEDAGVFAAFGRSRQLVRGYWWRTLGFTLLFMLFILVVSLGVLFVLSLIGFAIGFLATASGGGSGALESPVYIVLSTVLNLLGSAITTPLTYCAWVLYYYDLRVRKEGLDLAVRAEELAPTAPPVTTR
jgi:fumarate reductase subunit C